MQSSGPKRRKLEALACKETQCQKALTVAETQTTCYDVDIPQYTTTFAEDRSQGALMNTISVSHSQSNAPIHTDNVNHSKYLNHRSCTYGQPGPFGFQEAMNTRVSGETNINETVCFGEVSIPICV